MERILFAAFIHEDRNQSLAALRPDTNLLTLPGLARR
jgi:hypothetical protein